MITFDDTSWPLLIINFVGSNTDEQFDDYLKKMTEYLGRGEKYLCVLDSSKMVSDSIDHRRKQLEWLNEHDARLRQQVLGTAFVITSPLARLAMNVVFQLHKPAAPYTANGTFLGAVEWADKRFREENMLLASLMVRGRFGLGNKKAAV